MGEPGRDREQLAPHGWSGIGMPPRRHGDISAEGDGPARSVARDSTAQFAGERLDHQFRGGLDRMPDDQWVTDARR
jgi:hypothetical protein